MTKYFHRYRDTQASGKLNQSLNLQLFHTCNSLNYRETYQSVALNCINETDCYTDIILCQFQLTFCLEFPLAKLFSLLYCNSINFKNTFHVVLVKYVIYYKISNNLNSNILNSNVKMFSGI